ncbi:MAG: hypothetical protein WA080_08125 [Sulfuricurvum sp.]
MLAILIQIIESKFLIEPLTFVGSMATKAREAVVDAFQNDPKNNVFVYRFITKNSFEEKIDAMIKAKTAMGEMSVSVGETALASLNNDELKALFVR